MSNLIQNSQFALPVIAPNTPNTQLILEENFRLNPQNATLFKWMPV